MQFCVVRVQNNLPTTKLFDELCNTLSRLRDYASDYRMVSDFDPKAEKPYWHSNSYLLSQTDLITATLESVWADVRNFCSSHRIAIESFHVSTLVCGDDD